MTDLDRRHWLQLVGGGAAAGLFTWTMAETLAAADLVAQSRTTAGAYKPRFFTAAEFNTIVALSDLIIPKDAKSGSASEAGAPEFIDVIVAEQPERQIAMRGGLAWLDAECTRRFDKRFLACSAGERTQVLDDIAWPARVKPEHRQGARFFTTMRDLVAAGFFSSKSGVADLGYTGNRPFAWDGPPPEVLRRLGLN